MDETSEKAESALLPRSSLAYIACISLPANHFSLAAMRTDILNTKRASDFITQHKKVVPIRYTMDSPPRDDSNDSTREGIDVAGSISLLNLKRLPYHQLLHSSKWEHTGNILKFKSTLKSLQILGEAHIESCNLRCDTIDSVGNRFPERCLLAYSWHQDPDIFKMQVRGDIGSMLDVTMPHFNGCIVFVDNILPPAMELLGDQLHVEPQFFNRHIGDAWTATYEPTSTHQPSDSDSTRNIYLRLGVWSRAPSCSRMSLVRQNQASMPFAIRFPSIFDGGLLRAKHKVTLTGFQAHEFVLLEGYRDGRLRNVLKVFYTLEHISIKLEEIQGGKWQAVVLFPTIDHAKQSNRVDILDETSPLDFRCHYDKLGHFAKERCLQLNEPQELCLSLLEYSQAYWDSFLEIIDRSVAYIETFSSGTERPYGEISFAQNVKLAILKALVVLEETLDSMKELRRVGSVGMPPLFKASTAHDKHFERLFSNYGLLKVRLKRHLPIVGHQMNGLLSRQQVVNTEKQIEESQKAIEQAGSVKRLTTLAFVFIPISTMGTLFGMNIQELSAKPPSVWLFVAVTAWILISTLIIAQWDRVFSNFSWSQDD